MYTLKEAADRYWSLIVYFSLSKHVQPPLPLPTPHLVAHFLAAMSFPATILVSLVLALAQGTLTSYRNIT